MSNQAVSLSSTTHSSQEDLQKFSESFKTLFFKNLCSSVQADCTQPGFFSCTHRSPISLNMHLYLKIAILSISLVSDFFKIYHLKYHVIDLCAINSVVFSSCCGFGKFSTSVWSTHTSLVNGPTVWEGFNLETYLLKSLFNWFKICSVKFK